MTHNTLKNLEDSFCLSYEKESSYLTHILSLNLDKQIYYLKEHINEILLPLGLVLYEDRGVNGSESWHILFICKKNNYKKIMAILNSNNYENPSKLTKFFDIIHYNSNSRVTDLYKHLLESDFYREAIIKTPNL